MSVEIIHGDFLEVFEHSNKRFKLVFADPPFNIKQQYQGFSDFVENYDEWTLAWIRLALSLCGDVLCFHGNDDLAGLYLRIMKNFNAKRIAWINWHYRFGQCSRHNWIDARCHCLVYARPENYTWNPEAVLVDSDRKNKYKDKRIHETDNGGQRLPGTVWGVESDGPYWGRVQGNSKERRKGHPNQLPEKYLERLILAYTNEGDFVLDPFCGSGTTAVVCDALNRNCITTDISQANVTSAKKRLAEGAVRICEPTGTKTGTPS